MIVFLPIDFIKKIGIFDLAILAYSNIIHHGSERCATYGLDGSHQAKAQS